MLFWHFWGDTEQVDEGENLDEQEDGAEIGVDGETFHCPEKL